MNKEEIKLAYKVMLQLEESDSKASTHNSILVVKNLLANKLMDIELNFTEKEEDIDLSNEEIYLINQYRLGKIDKYGDKINKDEKLENTLEEAVD